MAYVPNHMLGFSMLSCTLALWVGSSITLQMIFGKGVEFQQPVFVTLFNSAMSVSLLTPRLARRCGFPIPVLGSRKRGSSDFDCGADDLGIVLRLSATVGFLWLFSQCLFNTSLLHTSVATSTVLSSTTTGFTFLFSLLICGDPFRWRSFGAAVFSFLGCALVALQEPRLVAGGSARNAIFGDALVLTSAAMFALVSVLLQRLAPGEIDLTSFMGMNGLIALGLSPALLYAAHHGGVEPFRPPPPRILALLAANALLGCTFANYLYTSALLLLSPLVANVCLSLSIPVSAFADGVLLGHHNFSIGWAFGAAFVSAGVVCAALDLDAAGTANHAAGAGCVRVTAPSRDPNAVAELRSLLAHNGYEGTDDDDYL